MQANINLQTFIRALQESWSTDTCVEASAWSEENPSRGQCVASSLVTQDYYGGDLRRYEVIFDKRKEMHYCNILPDGTILDTTGSQYRWPVILRPHGVDLKGFASIREKRLADEGTRRRYEILAARVGHKVQELAHAG